MNRRITFLTVVTCFVLAATTVFAYYNDLDRANRMRDNGDFWNARSLYRSVADNYYNDGYSRRQAAYFVGFCSIRLNDSWTAIEDYRRFLREYDNGNTTMVPDALYVLGRTYEAVGDTYRARQAYNECINRFRYGEFPEKSRDRLRYLGGGYPYPPNYSIESTNTQAQKATSKTATSKLGKTDPFEGFTMEVNTAKIEQLRQKFDQLHEQSN